MTACCSVLFCQVPTSSRRCCAPHLSLLLLCLMFFPTSLCGVLVWTRWPSRLLVWQAWPFETSTFVSRGRRGTWWHTYRRIHNFPHTTVFTSRSFSPPPLSFLPSPPQLLHAHTHIWDFLSHRGCASNCYCFVFFSCFFGVSILHFLVFFLIFFCMLCVLLLFFSLFGFVIVFVSLCYSCL